MSFVNRNFKLVVSLALATALLWGAILFFGSGNDSDDSLITHVVGRRTIRDAVVERGTLESQNTISGSCELPGESKIIFIVPEGSTVKTGDSVVRFDSEEIDREIAEKRNEVNQAEGTVDDSRQELEVQANINASAIAAADLALELAKLDLTKYRDGDYEAENADFERSIAEGEAELEKIRDELENMRDLVKKGFRAPEQIREIQLRLVSAGHRVDRDKLKLSNLRKYDRPRKIMELQANAEETVRKVERAITTAAAEKRKAEARLETSENGLKLLKEQLDELLKQRENCEIKAPQPGTVAFANRPWFDDDERIREGATVRQRQDVFYLPDMRRMQVDVDVHESVVNKVKIGQQVVIRVDAYPDTVFQGTIERISQLANSGWFQSTQNYAVVVFIDQFPEDVQLKPGMTAECEILVGTYHDIIAIPVNAVTEHFQQSYVFKVDGSLVKRVKVQVGRTTTSFLEITDGIVEGDELSLDAYQRGLDEFGEAEKEAREITGANDPAPEPSVADVPVQ